MRTEIDEEDDDEDKFKGAGESKGVVGEIFFDEEGGCEKDGGGGGGGKDRMEAVEGEAELLGMENVGICGTKEINGADCMEIGRELRVALSVAVAVADIVAVDVVKAANCLAISLEVAATISIMFSLCSLLSLSCLPSCSGVENCLLHNKQATTSLTPIGAVDDDKIGVTCFPVIAIDEEVLLLVEFIRDVDAKALLV